MTWISTCVGTSLFTAATILLAASVFFCQRRCLQSSSKCHSDDHQRCSSVAATQISRIREMIVANGFDFLVMRVQ